MLAKSIDFSGTAGQVRNTFQTEIHNLDVNSERHIANILFSKAITLRAPLAFEISKIESNFSRGGTSRCE